MKKSVYLFFFVFACITTLKAQNGDKNPEKPYIDVTGSAELEVIPDEIYIFIRLQERKQSRTVLQQETELKTRLTAIGIPLANLSVKNFVGDYRQYKVFKRDLQTVKEFSLKLSTAQQLDSVFQQLDLMDVEDAKIERLSHSKMPEFRKDVKTRAIIAAKEKADYLLAAIGEQTGKPIFINENEDSFYNTEMQVQSRSNAFVPRNYSGDEIGSTQFQKLRIKFVISARFSIK